MRDSPPRFHTNSQVKGERARKRLRRINYMEIRANDPAGSCPAGLVVFRCTVCRDFGPLSWISDIIHEILAAMANAPGTKEVSRPEWFAAFLADRGTRKPSRHTLKAYCQDFDAIATQVVGADTGDLSRMSLGDITTDSMRTAFAQYAKTHEAPTIQRCWSTWNVQCTFLYTSELAANPMPLVGRPKLAKTLPKALPTDSVVALLATLSSDPEPRRRSDWIDRDRALILTALLTGLRADELLRANVGDLRRTTDGAVIHVRGKGGKDRRVPIEPALVAWRCTGNTSRTSGLDFRSYAAAAAQASS